AKGTISALRDSETTKEGNRMESIRIGNEAPDFDLPDDSGGRVSLSMHRGRIVVLFFYPRDDTTACTAEAISFTALKDDFAAAGAVLIGISPDSTARHAKFKKKHALDLVLAADEDKAVAQAYG